MGIVFFYCNENNTTQTRSHFNLVFTVTCKIGNSTSTIYVFMFLEFFVMELLAKAKWVLYEQEHEIPALRAYTA
jgi:hypothetical protein